MNLQRLTDSLKKHEGVKQIPYTDTEGNLTVGVGHLCSRPLPLSVVDLLLSEDIQAAVRELDRQFFGWSVHNDARQEVLIELMFNMGPKRLAGFIKMWDALGRRDYESAAKEMENSKWATQVKGRAKTLADQMKTGLA